MIIKHAKMDVLNKELNVLEESDSNLKMSSKLVQQFIENTIIKFNRRDKKIGELTNDKFDVIKLEPNNFDVLTGKLSKELFSIVKDMSGVSSGILLTVTFSEENSNFIAYFKADFLTNLSVEKNGDLIREKMLLPESGVAVSEGIVIDLNSLKYFLVEKSYLTVDGNKFFYFSDKFLELGPDNNEKDAINSMYKNIKDIAKKFDIPEHEAVSNMQSAMNEDIEEDGLIRINDIARSVFKDNNTAREKLKEELKNNNIGNVIKLEDPIKSTKKYSKHKFNFEGGINISIPDEIMNDEEKVKFINNKDGSVTIDITANEITPKFKA